MPHRIEYDFCELMKPGQVDFVITAKGQKMLVGKLADGTTAYFDWARCSGATVSPDECREAITKYITDLEDEAAIMRQWLFEDDKQSTTVSTVP